MEGGSSPASQEGLGQLRGAAQLTTSQLSSAPLQSLVHHCMYHCTDWVLHNSPCVSSVTVQVDSDSIITSDRRTDNTVTVV